MECLKKKLKLKKAGKKTLKVTYKEGSVTKTTTVPVEVIKKPAKVKKVTVKVKVKKKSTKFNISWKKASGAVGYEITYGKTEKKHTALTTTKKLKTSYTDEEKEFAIFTQEMAISNVQRLTKPTKPAHKVRNKGKYQQQAQALVEKEIITINTHPTVQESGMRTAYVAPTIAVTQIEKGADVVEEPDVVESMTKNQKQLIHNVKRYEARYGMVIALRLRGLALNAALSRFDSFVDACIADKKPFALVICGKGIGSDGAPVIKEGVIARCKRDSRIVEYAPVINEDGDFGSLYVAFCVSQ